MFSVRIANDDLVFSAGHFITLDGGQCERLHGHSYRVTAEMSGPLDENQYVLDFVAVRGSLKTILSELDHRVLLPATHPEIRVATRAKEVEVHCADRRWVLPRDDCSVLPIANTTTELLAQYIARRLLATLTSQQVGLLERLRIEVGEGTGFSAACELAGADWR